VRVVANARAAEGSGRNVRFEDGRRGLNRSANSNFCRLK